MSAPILSVVICTRNRVDLAYTAVASVLSQDLPQSEYELLVVDNASTDRTRQMVLEFCDVYPNIRYVLETNVGLSHARNRGWQEARGEYVGYLDDDCKVPAEWLSAACRVATEIRPEVFGGPYYAFYDTPKPVWFKDEYGSNFQGGIARSLDGNEYISGGNMFIRRDVLSQLKGFDCSLGMKGERKGYGEETNFFIRLRSNVKNSVIYYDPKVFIYHLVRPEKFGLYHTISTRFVGGRQHYNVLEINDQPHVFSAILAILDTLLEIVKSVTWGILRRDRKAYPFPQNYIHEHTSMYIFRLGYQVEQLKASTGFWGASQK